MPGPVIEAHAAAVELFGTSPDSIFSDRLSARVAAGGLARFMLAPTRASRKGLASLLTATAEVPLPLSLRDHAEPSLCFPRCVIARRIRLGTLSNLPSSLQSG